MKKKGLEHCAFLQKALKLLRFGAWCFGLVPMHEVIKTALIKNSVMAVRRANTQSKQGILMATSRAIYPLVFCGLMIPRQAKRMLLYVSLRNLE